MGNVEGNAPGFVNDSAQDFHLSDNAAAGGKAGPLPAAVMDYPPEYQYVRHQQYEMRPVNSISDTGAFERVP